MKRLIATIWFVCFVLSASYSQELFDTYTSKNLMGKKFEIKLKVFENNTYAVRIQVQSLDALRTDVGFELREKELIQFIEDLKSSKNQYIEWKGTAVSNNITSLEREIKTKRRWFNTYFISSNTIYSSLSHWPKHLFTIKEDNSTVSYRLIVFTGKQQASTNQFIRTDGGILVFSDEFEIDEFLEKINPSDIKAFADGLIKKSQLFNE